MELYIARDKDGRLYIYVDRKPFKVEKKDGWDIRFATEQVYEIDESLFPEITWEDDEPTKFVSLTPGTVTQVYEVDFPEEENDPIQPDHYQSDDMEVMDVLKAFMTEEEFRGFCKGNIIKYILRERQKNGIEDIKKIQRYKDELEELEEKSE